MPAGKYPTFQSDRGNVYLRYSILLATLLAAAAQPFAAEAPAGAEAPVESSAGSARNLEIGGLVTLDHQSRLDASGNPDLSLKQVALGANVTVTPEILASVLLKAERDLDHIFFDQAMASLTPAGSAWSLLFGQQTFNHGLLSTRLISDPEILPDVEIKQPGLSAARVEGEFTAGLGLAVQETQVGDYASRDYLLIPNVDWAHAIWEVRLSGLFSRYRSDCDLAASLAWERFRFDAEGFRRFTVWDGADRMGGYYLGAEIAVAKSLSLAFRHDGLLEADGGSPASTRNGAGLTVSLKHDLFAAAEYSYGTGSGQGGHQLALQIGLKSTLNLPGFQRETLSQE